MRIRRGTTRNVSFGLPVPFGMLKEAWLTFSQRSEEVFTKTLDDMTCDGRVVWVKLTQENTLKLDENCCVEIQLRGLMTNGEAIASEITKADVDGILREGVI